MSQELWTSVDAYVDDLVVRQDAVLAETLAASDAAGLPRISVSPSLGKLLHLLARAIEARNILELGTLGGYSTIWLARALPERGRLVTVEADPRHAVVAGKNIARAGLTWLVDLRVGRALDVLPLIAAEGLGPFDLVFVDADKAGNPDYFAWARRLTRLGSIIIVDNVIRKGAVVSAESTDASVQGVRRLNELIARQSRVSATTIQTVGTKGYDGFTLALVVA